MAPARACWIRSKTSITGPTSMVSPVSSSTSRARAASSVSPSSTVPPGRLHSPFRGGCPRLTRSTRSPSTTTAPTPTTGCAGNSLKSDSHHLDDDALPSLTVELCVEDLLPWPEIEPAGSDRQDDLVAHDRAFEVRIGVVLA